MTGFWKKRFQITHFYFSIRIYHCNMKSIAFPIIFHMVLLLLNQNLENCYSIINFGYILRQIRRKIWHYKTSSFSKFCTSPPRRRIKKNSNSDFFDVIQDVFADIQAFLFPNFWIPKYHCVEKIYRHSEFRLQT